jgi:hypothetical protein
MPFQDRAVAQCGWQTTVALVNDKRVRTALG